jgi:hypothetical protein
MMPQASSRRAQVRAELVAAAAVGGQCPGQEPAIAFGDEHPDADELVLALPGMAGTKSISPDSRHAPSGPSAVSRCWRMTPVQQHRRPGRQLDPIEEPWNLIRP